MENLGLVLNRDREIMAGMGTFWSWALFSFLQTNNWDVKIFRLYREFSGFYAFFWIFKMVLDLHGILKWSIFFFKSSIINL